MDGALKITANGPTEQRILDYLNENASEVLAAKINAGKKTLAGAVRYATEEARKLAAGSGCVCVDDATVFGWIVHFFEEDEIAEPKKEKARGVVRAPSGVKEAPKKARGPRSEIKDQNKEKPAEPEQPQGPIFLELFTNEELQGAAK